MFSVDPTKFGTMFTCELDFIVHAIPMYFSKEEFVEECADVLGMYTMYNIHYTMYNVAISF